MLDGALVALGGEEGVACGGVFAKRLLGGQRVDGVCDAGVAEGGGGWFLGGLEIFLNVRVRWILAGGGDIFLPFWLDITCE